MWVCAKAAVPEPATIVTAPAATASARRVAFIGRDSRKLGSIAATDDLRSASAESRRGDSNPRPTTYEAVALPLSYSGGAARITDHLGPTGRLVRPPLGLLTLAPFRQAPGAAMMRA